MSDQDARKHAISRAVDEVLDEEPGHAPRAVAVAVDEVLDEHGLPPRVRVAVPEDEGEAAPVAPWAEKLVRFLDDGIRIPGTELGIGADGIIGFFFPAVGDLVTGSGSLALLYLALKERVPTVALARMVVNIGIDTLLGAFPVVGDVFDVFWKANRKNLEIIERYRDDPQAKPSALDYVLVTIALLLIVASIVLPMLVLWALAGAGILAADQLLGQ
jgi:hypothetical protein